VPITDANKSELVRAAALQRLLYSRSRGLAALKRGLVDSSGLRPALMLFAGSSASFGALFFGQQYLPVDQVLGALWFSRDVPEQLAQALLRVVSRLSEVALRTFWAAATGSVRTRSDARVLVMMQTDELGSATGAGARPAAGAAAAAAAGLVQFVPQAQLLLLPRLPAGAQQQQQQSAAAGAGLDVLLGQRLLLALNLGEAAYSSAAQQQARLTALELQKVLQGLQGDVKAGVDWKVGWEALSSSCSHVELAVACECFRPHGKVCNHVVALAEQPANVQHIACVLCTMQHCVMTHVILTPVFDCVIGICRGYIHPCLWSTICHWVSGLNAPV
jgi:hypothetical protein